MANINSFVVYTTNTLREGETPLSRYQYIVQLSCPLVEPGMRSRLSTTMLRRNNRQDLALILDATKNVTLTIP